MMPLFGRMWKNIDCLGSTAYIMLCIYVYCCLYSKNVFNIISVTVWLMPAPPRPIDVCVRGGEGCKA